MNLQPLFLENEMEEEIKDFILEKEIEKLSLSNNKDVLQNIMKNLQKIIQNYPYYAQYLNNYYYTFQFSSSTTLEQILFKNTIEGHSKLIVEIAKNILVIYIHLNQNNIIESPLFYNLLSQIFEILISICWFLFTYCGNFKLELYFIQDGNGKEIIVKNYFSFRKKMFKFFLRINY